MGKLYATVILSIAGGIVVGLTLGYRWGSGPGCRETIRMVTPENRLLPFECEAGQQMTAIHSSSGIEIVKCECPGERIKSPGIWPFGGSGSGSGTLQ